VFVGAVALWVVYGRISGVAHGHFSVSPFPLSLRGATHHLPQVLRDAIGHFGAMTIQLPEAAIWVWWILVLVLVAVGLLLGGRRERVALGAVVIGVLAFPVLAQAWIYRFSGFGLQGRQVLPILVLIPLVAGELAGRHMAGRSPARPRWPLGGALALIAVLQAYAWWYNARNVAGAPDTVRFYAHALWSPPLGWVPLIVMVALGTISLLGFAVREALRGSQPQTAPCG
jgi:Predicted membrane protein (DUF2142)